jgi:hypothetical protein
MNKIKKLSSCGSFSEVGKVMRNEKTNTTDEFLVKKKDPLTLPPKYSDLPRPGTIKKKKENENEAKKIEEIFKIKKEKTSNKKINQNIEESILNKIGK